MLGLGEWHSTKWFFMVLRKDELLFLTYPKKSIPPPLNISVSFVPCQVTHAGGGGLRLTCAPGDQDLWKNSVVCLLVG